MKNLHNINPTKEIAKGETTDVMEYTLFTKISEKILGESKISDMLPIMKFIQAESKFQLNGLNKFFYNRDMEIELVKLVKCN